MKVFYKYLIMIIVGSIALPSCMGLLDERSEGSFNNSNSFNTEADALSALLYAYAPLGYIEYTGRFMLYMGDVTTNQYHMYGKAQETKLYTWDVDTNTEEFLYFYKYCYITIMRSNNVLENVPKMGNISELKRKQFLGEALFLRAFSYFMLVKNYGSVPYRSKVVGGSSDISIAKAPINDIYSKIIADLEQASGMMTIAKMQGRIDKVGAQALLSKVYLTMASSKMTGAPGYEWVDEYEKVYAQAAKWSAEVLDNQRIYTLDPNLSRVYDIDNQADGSEHIFITSMSREGNGYEGTYSQLPMMFGIPLADVFIPSSPTEEGSSVRRFVNTPGSGCWSVFRTDKDFYKSFSDADLRKKLMISTIYNENGTVKATYHENNINEADEVRNAFYYPFSCKYTDYKSKNFRCSSNIYLIRFAEVALIYAEAAGPTTEGYFWVNEVRKRAGLGELTPGLDVQAFRKAIWDEREFELAFEGHGLYDLRRTNRVMEKVTNKKVKESYAYFFPIPQREQDLNQ